METRRKVRRIIKLENEDSRLAETIIHEHVEKQRLRLQQEELAQRQAEARDKLSAEVTRELKQKREQQLLQIHLVQEQMKTRHQCGLESECRKAQQRWRRTEKCAQNNKRLLEERHKSQAQEERETQKETKQEEYEEQVEMAIHRASMENRIALPLWGQRNGEVDNRLHFYKDGQGFIVNSKRKFEPRQSLILTDETPKKQVTVPQGNTSPKPKSVKRLGLKLEMALLYQSDYITSSHDDTSPLSPCDKLSLWAQNQAMCSDVPSAKITQQFLIQLVSAERQPRPVDPEPGPMAERREALLLRDHAMIYARFTPVTKRYTLEQSNRETPAISNCVGKYSGHN
uniref:Uncharacterized protein n=1 Tax=Knipowitschia caucasica TaxID=637954 RepID=A0AAV2KHM7_KNICA